MIRALITIIALRLEMGVLRREIERLRRDHAALALECARLRVPEHALAQ